MAENFYHQERRFFHMNDKRSSRRPRYPMPDDIRDELNQCGLMEAYLARPPYQRNDYIGWITRAKRVETREKRLRQMLDELQRADAYMKMPYKSR